MMDVYGRIWGFVRSKRCHITRDNEKARAVMKSSHIKGNFVEHQLSQDGWLPSLSVESEDGEQWRRLRAGFDSILSQCTAWREKLPGIIDTVVTDVCTTHAIIDADIVAQAVASIMVELLFGPQCKLSPDKRAIYGKARNEWAKTLAVKGAPNVEFRRDFFLEVEQLVLASKYVRPQGWDLTDLEWVSCFFQPWIVSPMINVADIFMNVEGEEGEVTKEKERDVTASILKSIDNRHPFPLFEREVTRNVEVGKDSIDYHKGDHVFIMNDSSSSCCLRFGDGERKCPGQSVAMLLLTSLLTSFRRQTVSSFQPQIKGNNLWSGSSNDSGISWFRFMKLLRLLLQPELKKRDWIAKFATEDRWKKFYYGTIRLLLFLYLLSISNYGGSDGSVSTLLLKDTPYGSAILIGVVGAITNTSLWGKRIDAILCFGTLLGVLWWYVSNVSALSIISSYALKTAVGDTLAGKTDQTIYVIITLLVIGVCFLFIESKSSQQWIGIGWLTLAQFICEWFDKNYDHIKFFRHRWLYEMTTAVLILTVTSSPLTLSTVRYDLVAVLFYRMSNALIIYIETA